MKVKLTLPTGVVVRINVGQAELERLSQLEGHHVQVLPEYPAAEALWIYCMRKRPTKKPAKKP